MQNIIPKQDKTGLVYYEELPPDVILAEEKMFYDDKGKPNYWMPYLLHSFATDQYFALRVGDYFPPPLFKQFLNQNRVYVFVK